MRQLSVTAWRDRVDRAGEPIAIGGLVLVVEFLALILYLQASTVQPKSVSLYLVPFVWINVGLLALWRIRPTPDSVSQRRLAFGIAGGYLLILSVAGGIVSPGHALHGHLHSTGFRIAWLPPGWGPAVLYGGAYLNLAVIPYQTFGYLVLTYLVYVTVREATGTLVSGIFGLFSCVSCTLPVFAALASGLFGGSSALAAAAYSQSYVLSTVVFVLTVGLLSWRPSIRR